MSRGAPTLTTRMAACAAALLLAAPVLPARAQLYEILGDADAARLLPVVAASRAEGERRHDAVQATLVDDQAAVERFTRDVQAGRVDLEALLRRYSPHAAVPPGARYDARCSQGSVRPGWFSELRGQLAISYVLDGGAAGAARAVAFYEARGFRAYDRSAEGTMLRWRDERADSLHVRVGQPIVPAWAPDEQLRGCAHLTGRQVITLSLRSFTLTQHHDVAAPRVASAVATRERALAAAGLSAERFEALLAAAMMARQDADDGAELEQLAAMAAGVPDVRASVEARRRNVAWYRRHQRTLEPALGAYVAQLGRS